MSINQHIKVIKSGGEGGMLCHFFINPNNPGFKGFLK